MPCSHVHLVGVARTLETQSQRALWLSSPRLKNSNISSVFFLLRCPKASLKSLYTHSILEVFHNFCSFSERRPGSPLHWDAVTERRKSFSFSAILPSNLQQLSKREGCGFGGWCGEVGTVWGHAAGWGQLLSPGWEEEAVPCLKTDGCSTRSHSGHSQEHGQVSTSCRVQQPSYNLKAL